MRPALGEAASHPLVVGNPRAEPGAQAARIGGPTRPCMAASPCAPAGAVTGHDRPPIPAALLAAPIAHRGLWGPGVPENSIAAARAAAAAGYGVEADLQLSADGRAMVFHDDRLDRLTPETGPLRERRAAELAAIPLRGGAEGIPTLAAFLAAVAGRAPLLLEIKDQDGALGPEVGALEAAVAADLARYDGPVAVMSFNPHSMAAVRDVAPNLPRGLVTGAFAPADWPGVPAARLDRLRAIASLDEARASFVSHDARDLAAPAVAALACPVLAWTIRSPAEERAARRVARQITFEGYRPAVAPKVGTVVPP